MTANALVSDRKKCLDAGMNDYISKPIDPLKLSAALERWLRHPELQTKQNNVETGDIVLAGKQETTGGDPHPSEMIFDMAAFSERLMGDAMLIWTVSEAFLADIPIQLESFKIQVEANDVAQAAALAHGIKGASANVGGVALTALAAKLEQDGKTGDLSAVQAGVVAMEEGFAQLKKSMEGTLSELE